MSRSPTRPSGSCPRSCRSRPTAPSAPGFVAADGGLILTASHVVGRSETVTLRLQDGTSVSGAVVAVDKSIDTAVIRADESARPI